MQLDGPELQQVREALISAYPTRPDLERMVFDGLSVHLGAITSLSTLSQVIFELLRWAQAQGKLEELVQAAVEHNSGNQELQRVAAQIGVKSDQSSSDVPLSMGPRYWNIPYPRNPFFTGQEAVLTQLATALKAGQATALSQPQAISGLGGIGKTQIAIEYAYRHREEYQAVFWVLSDTRESLVSGYIAVAQRLGLPQKDQQDQQVIIEAVKMWLQTHSSWLLILDNADELAIVRKFVPPSFGGHILLTTRAQAMGRLANRIEVEIMPTEVGALFLLRRAGLVGENASLSAASSSNVSTAREISEELGGLPLALDQAGAYIEQSQCSLSDYLSLYRTQRSELLSRRGGLIDDHPESVATTWSLSFERVEQKDPAAADLLRFCAFVHPDAIPLAMIVHGAHFLSSSLREAACSPLLLNDAVAALLDYSLVRRNMEEKTLSVHRLVQTVLSNTMDEQRRIDWQRQAVLVVNMTCPDVGDIRQWDECERWLPHALMCAVWIEQEPLKSLLAARLLNEAACYLDDRARYGEAEPLYERALKIREEQLGESHPETAISLNNLALLYENQGKYGEAELLYERALKIREEQLGESHPETAQSLNNLAGVYLKQGKYEHAEVLLQCALNIREEHLGPKHTETAQSLNGLAMLYDKQGKYERAETLYERALKIQEEQLGPTHPEMAVSLNNLALLYYHQDKYEKAEPLYERALRIQEEQLGESHPSVAAILNNLAGLYLKQGKYSQAEPLYERALRIQEEQLGESHPETARSLNNLAVLYHDQGKYSQAEALYERALKIREERLGESHPETVNSLSHLRELYRTQGKYSQAETLSQRALSINEEQLGPDHPDTAIDLRNLAKVYIQRRKYAEAQSLLQRALSIFEQQLGVWHPHTAATLSILADLYQVQGKNQVAEQLYQCALSIYEQTLGETHPDTASSLNNLGSFYCEQGRNEEAEPLLQRVLTIRELALGPDHPNTQNTRRWYVKLLRTLGRDEEAAELSNAVSNEGVAEA